jgi:hypothetical protein
MPFVIEVNKLNMIKFLFFVFDQKVRELLMDFADDEFEEDGASSATVAKIRIFFYDHPKCWIAFLELVDILRDVDVKCLWDVCEKDDWKLQTREIEGSMEYRLTFEDPGSLGAALDIIKYKFMPFFPTVVDQVRFEKESDVDVLMTLSFTLDQQLNHLMRYPDTRNLYLGFVGGNNKSNLEMDYDDISKLRDLLDTPGNSLTDFFEKNDCYRLKVTCIDTSKPLLPQMIKTAKKYSSLLKETVCLHQLVILP